MTIALWVAAILMIIVGLVGTVLPALPGVALVFGGILLAAWIDDFARISAATVGVLAVLSVLGIAIDYVASFVTAQRAGASRLGLLGAALGTIAGIFTGLIGLVFLPLVGAFVGEFVARRDLLHAGRIGIAAWIGLLVAAALKIAIVFTMVGIFLGALAF